MVKGAALYISLIKAHSRALILSAGRVPIKGSAYSNPPASTRPATPGLASHGLLLIGDSRPSSSPSPFPPPSTRSPLPRHDRVLPPLRRSVGAHCGRSHTGVRSCSAYWRGNALRSAEERDTVGCLFWSELLGISGANAKRASERWTTCRDTMTSLVNSACLLFLPVALLLSEYRHI